jgi:hypothetical protein
LFVGESAPVSGGFFYRGNPLVTQSVMSAIEESLPGRGTIASFKANSWYLDDLSITPIDNLRGKARRDACVAARESLAERRATHKTLAIRVLDAWHPRGCRSRDDDCRMPLQAYQHAVPRHGPARVAGCRFLQCSD